jgi:hypothetical protein
VEFDSEHNSADNKPAADMAVAVHQAAGMAAVADIGPGS